MLVYKVYELISDPSPFVTPTHEHGMIWLIIWEILKNIDMEFMMNGRFTMGVLDTLMT